MIEELWLKSKDPKPLLRFLLGTDDPRVQDVESFPDCKGSDRKLRLFACVCYDRIRHLLPNPIARAAVDVARRFADNKATAEELRDAEALVRAPLDALEGQWRASQVRERIALAPTHEALALALQTVWSSAPKAAYYASSNAHLAYASITHPHSDRRRFESQRAEEQAQSDMLRDIFGNPVCPVTLDPRWISSTVLDLAHTIYDEFGHIAPGLPGVTEQHAVPGSLSSNPRQAGGYLKMPILADALMDAGCDCEEIINHCRSEGPHVRGCWVVDLVLGKK